MQRFFFPSIVLSQAGRLGGKIQMIIKYTKIAIFFEGMLSDSKNCFWAHYELVTIHPWADGNGRTSRLLMNLLQWEFGVLPTKVLKEDKTEYIQALIDTRESEDINVFLNCMAALHCRHLQTDIDQYVKSASEKMVDKSNLKQEMVDKWSIKPSLAEKLVDILGFLADKDETTTESIVSHFGFPATSAKRYLRQLVEFGYLEARGGNKNRTYIRR